MMPKKSGGLLRGSAIVFLVLGLAGALYCAVLVWRVLPTGSGQDYFWENQRVGEHRTESNPVYTPHYPNLRSALIEPGPSPYELVLDGQWHSTLAANPSEVYPRLLKRQLDLSDWDTVQIPSLFPPNGDQRPLAWCCENSTLLGWLKNTFPRFEGINPPYVPLEGNSTRLFRRSFELPENWRRKQIRVNFSDPRGAFSVWVNGVHIGYAESDGGDVEFDISDAISERNNTIVVAFVRWSDADYLANPEVPHLRGFGDSVRLLARNSAHYRHFQIRSEPFDNSRELRFLASVAHDGAGRFSGTVEFYLMPPFFRPVEEPTQPIARQHVILDSGTRQEINLSAALKKPQLWYPDSPALYTAVAVMRTDKGKVLDVVKRRLAFRDSEWRGTELRLNGAAYPLRAVRYEPRHPGITSKMGDAELLADLRLLKLHNVNAIYSGRVAYPNRLLNLADEEGFIVIDSLGLTTRFIGDSTEWQDELQRRFRRGVEKAQAHPAVLGLALSSSWPLDYSPEDQRTQLLTKSEIDKLVSKAFAPSHGINLLSLMDEKRRPTSEALRYSQENAAARIVLEPMTGESLLIDNRNNRLPMQNNYRLFKRVTYKNGQAKVEKIPLKLAGGQQTKVPTYIQPLVESGKVAAVNYELRPLADSRLLNRSDVLQVEQQVLSHNLREPLAGLPPEPLQASEEGSHYRVFNSRFEVQFNQLTGELYSITLDGDDLLSAPISGALITPIKNSEISPRKDQVELIYYFETKQAKGNWRYTVFNHGQITLQLSPDRYEGQRLPELRVKLQPRYGRLTSFAKLDGGNYYRLLDSELDLQQLILGGNQWLAMRNEQGAGLKFGLDGQPQVFSENTLYLPATKAIYTLRLIPANREKQGSTGEPPRTWRLQTQGQPQVEFRGPN